VCARVSLSNFIARLGLSTGLRRLLVELNRGRVHSACSTPCSVIAANPTPIFHTSREITNCQLPAANCQLGRRRRQGRQDKTRRIYRVPCMCEDPAADPSTGWCEARMGGDHPGAAQALLSEAEEARNSDLEYTPPPPLPSVLEQKGVLTWLLGRRAASWMRHLCAGSTVSLKSRWKWHAAY
jgi:hypothetical protein